MARNWSGLLHDAVRTGLADCAPSSPYTSTLTQECMQKIQQKCGDQICESLNSAKSPVASCSFVSGFTISFKIKSGDSFRFVTEHGTLVEWSSHPKNMKAGFIGVTAEATGKAYIYVEETIEQPWIGASDSYLRSQTVDIGPLSISVLISPPSRTLDMAIADAIAEATIMFNSTYPDHAAGFSTTHIASKGAETLMKGDEVKTARKDEKVAHPERHRFWYDVSCTFAPLSERLFLMRGSLGGYHWQGGLETKLEGRDFQYVLP